MSNTSLLGSFGGQAGESLMFRNHLINGCFRVWQRGTSQTSTGYESDDRWLNLNGGSTKTHSQQPFILGQTDVPGNPQFFSRTVVSSVVGAGNYTTKHQKVESVRTLAGQTATLSFWAKADAPKNMAVEFYQEFGNGGSPSAAVSGIGVTTIALTASWKYYTVTVNIPSISGKTLGTNNDDNVQVIFWFDAGSTFNARTNSLGQQSGTFDIANAMLEAGPTATPFERRPYSVELGMCQRYFEIINMAGDYIEGQNTTYLIQSYGMKVTKRATPTSVTSAGQAYYSGGTGGVVFTPTILSATTDRARIGSNGLVNCNGFSDGLISVSAEL